jgi:hypothetical protein
LDLLLVATRAGLCREAFEDGWRRFDGVDGRSVGRVKKMRDDESSKELGFFQSRHERARDLLSLVEIAVPADRRRSKKGFMAAKAAPMERSAAA